MRRAIAVILLFIVGSVQAAVIVTVVETGGDVVSSGGGSLDLSGLGYDGSFFDVSGGQISPITGLHALGAPSLTDIDTYGPPLTTPTYGTGGNMLASSGTGDLFGVRSDFPGVAVPIGYISGGALSGSSTFAGQTFASLGITPGTYVWSWSSDTFTLNIVPIPAAVWLFGSGLGLLGWMKRKRA
jgi:hypothetical protein